MNRLGLLLGALVCAKLVPGSLATSQPHKRFFLDSVSENDAETTVKQIFDKVVQDQAQEDVPAKEFVRWAKTKGLYSSEVKLNFHGDLAQTQIRRNFRVFDNNLFASAWVTSNLLEAYMYGVAPKPTPHQLNIALEAFPMFTDKNAGYETSCLAFWPQVQNQTTKFYRSTPSNLFYLLDSSEKFPVGVITNFLKTVGLGGLAGQLQGFLDQRERFATAFRVPADFDDTFVNLGVGAALYERRSEFRSSWTLWDRNNKNITSVFDALRKYAYRPFSSDPNVNIIDARTYYYLRGFLDEAKAREETIALATTWIQNQEELRQTFGLGNKMPFQINNVDLTVAANVIHGLTHSVLSGLVDTAVLENADLAQIYLNTSSLIAYEIKTNLTDRPDLALTYYPPVIEFYWFVTRTLAHLDAALRKGPLPVPVMQQVHDILKEACETVMTEALESQATPGPTLDQYYYDDFLGEGDVGLFNRPINRGEDRVFTTAMAANALMYTWTYYNEDVGTVRWKSGVSERVKKVVEGSIRWLSENTLNDKYEKWNAFFSGSVKGMDVLPFWYPGNTLAYANGTPVEDWSHLPNSDFYYGVRGHIPQQQYDQMIQQKHFNVSTPTVFHGYNAGAPFPFWSSQPFTYSSVLIAIARFENIVGGETS